MVGFVGVGAKVAEAAVADEVRALLQEVVGVIDLHDEDPGEQLAGHLVQVSGEFHRVGFLESDGNDKAPRQTAGPWVVSVPGGQPHAASSLVKAERRLLNSRM
jgi:hypothetical protein